jgi:hypothetical protein
MEPANLGGDAHLISLISLQIRSNNAHRLMNLQSNNGSQRILEHLEEREFSNLFGFPLCRRGRIALLNTMEVYQLTVSDVRRFRAIGFLCWTGGEIRLSACPFTILYGLIACFIMGINCIVGLSFFLYQSNGHDYFDAYCMAFVSVSGALCIWTYVLFLNPYWELRNVRAAARKLVAG